MTMIADDNVPVVFGYQKINDMAAKHLVDMMKTIPKCNEMTYLDVVIKTKKNLSDE
jgi:hypothetical protein